MFNPGFLLADLAFEDFFVPDDTSHGFLFGCETSRYGMEFYNAKRYFRVTVAMTYGLIPPAKEVLR